MKTGYIVSNSTDGVVIVGVVIVGVVIVGNVIAGVSIDGVGMLIDGV